MRRVLYVTADGILDHLGFSQVLRVIEALAQRGIPYALASMERARDLENRERVEAVRARLRAAGIPWEHGTWRESGGGARVAGNMAALLAIAERVARRERAGLVHARGYHGALVARALRLALGIRYLFDARGAWIDERLEEHRWFTTPGRLRVARAVEHRLFADAAGIVTLTALQAGDVALAHPSRRSRPIRVIPTCADYDAFGVSRTDALARLPDDARRALAGRTVLAIVGSLNRAYEGPEAARLCALVLARRPEARVLVLTAQRAAWERCFADAGVAQEQLHVTRADHEAMPAWLAVATWGLLLLTPDSAAKRAMMPTKLAEFFASRVRPVIHGCNPEVRDWVRRAGSGLVLERLDERALADAADAMCAASDDGSVERARERTAPHFSLASGIERYEALLRELS